MSSLDHARKAKIPVDYWCSRIRLGGYKYENTEWYKALKALEAEAKIGAGSTSPTGGSGGAVTPPPAPVHPYESLIFCAQDPLTALKAPARYGIVLTADYGPRRPDDSGPAWQTDEEGVRQVVKAFRKQNRRVLAWADCRPAPGGTPASEAVQMVADYGLDGWVGQGESAAEFDHAWAYAAAAIIGNLSSLTADQKARIKSGYVTFIQEVYKNEDASLQPNFENLPVQVCIGLYPGASGYVPLQWYKQNGFFPPGASVYYSGGISEQDWAEL